MSTANPVPLPDEPNDNERELALRLGEIRDRIVIGNGAPAHTPIGPQLYMDLAGGAGTTLYVYEPGPAAWNALA